MTDEELLSETSLSLLKPPGPVQVPCLEQGGVSLAGNWGIFPGSYELP